MNNKKPKKTKRPEGRPRIKINWKVFDGLCEIFCTLEEIASFFKCSEDTIERAVLRDKGMNFADYYRLKSPSGKISLRRHQIKLSKKNVAMAIFLGKNYLGQKDGPPSWLGVFDPTKCTMEQLERIMNGEDPGIVLSQSEQNKN